MASINDAIRANRSAIQQWVRKVSPRPWGFDGEITLMELGNDLASKESSQFPVLADLVLGYFHQDHDLISNNPDQIVAVFKEENSPKDN